MELTYKILLDEKERDMLIDLIEHRIYLLKHQDDRPFTETQKEVDILQAIGDRLTWTLSENILSSNGLL